MTSRATTKSEAEILSNKLSTLAPPLKNGGVRARALQALRKTTDVNRDKRASHSYWARKVRG